MTEATEQLTIRPVEPLDTEAIEAIDEQVTGRYRPDHWENQVRYYLMRDAESALVAEQGGQVVGFLFGDVRGWEFGFEEPTGWIEVLGVRPDLQGEGIGHRLAEGLLQHWKTRGVEKVRTLVHDKDESIARFMQSLGMARSPITAFEMPLGGA